MSIFNPHKNGRPPQGLETPAPARDAESAARLEEAAHREDWYEVHRLWQAGGQPPLPGDTVHPLASYLIAENRPDDALSLLNGFAGRHPEHPDVVKNYLLAVNIMRRDFGDHAGARELLERLAQTYPEHPDYPLIQQAQERST